MLARTRTRALPTFFRGIRFIPTLLKDQYIASKLKRIYTHTFNDQLFDGTLSAPVFGRYLHDDDIYLRHYAKTLKVLSEKMQTQNPGLAHQLSHIATDIVAGEQNMQEQYKEYFTRTIGAKPGKAIENYINFINKHAEHSEYPVALCSIFPCFWIYYMLGKRSLYPHQLTHNPYKLWIKTYSSSEFVTTTFNLAETINRLAEKSENNTRAKMKEAFKKAVDHELEFFDEVYGIHVSPMAKL